MNRRQLAISLCFAALLTGAIFLWTPAPKAALPAAREIQALERPRRVSAPPQVVYSALFHHVVAVKEQAEAEERQGRDASSLRSMFRQKADLSDVQGHLLETIATDCVREVAAQDARAQMIINAFKVRFPPGRLPPGVKLPPPPPELKQMQEERDAMILRARERLRLSLGEDEFQRFEGFVTRRVASQIEPTALQSRFSERTQAASLNSSRVGTTEGGAK
ncbi:MAG TPA: hypothetical protein VNO50_17335 [Pyrinomonadaceae bacterium]|nr:hypothetical protein [Pyrinomonadaceae bacterium]